MRISLNIIATSKYILFLEKIYKTLDPFFFKDSEVLVIVHTDQELPSFVKEYGRIKIIKNEIPHESWPFTTLKRFHYFISAKKYIENSDYSFYIDVDSIFIGEISENFLPPSGMMGTIHPCLFMGPGTPERNPESKAYIPHYANNRYFCGGFFGGKSEDFLKMSEKIKENIDDDLSRNVMAIWHDESHLNRYFYENPPAHIFEHPFASAETLQVPDPERSKILFLDKNNMGGHDFFRN